MEKAVEVGFDVVGFAPADLDVAHGEALEAFTRAGLHGDMGWMGETLERRRHPRALWPDARSVIVLGTNYGPPGDPLALLERRDRANVSVYARGDDYHDLVKKRLKRVARWLAESQGCEVKVFVDTAPVMEKPLAERAGVGWRGKHTNLVSRQFGSWLFLGSIFTSLDLPADAPHADRCGSCRRCLDACPTDAFPAPRQIDARRCISYLTIEHKGHIAREFRAAMGNRVYGCDDCLAVCPWNRFATRARETGLMPRVELTAPRIADLLRLDDAAFRRVFSKSPVKRLGRERFLRNTLIAAGNSGAPALADEVAGLLDDPSPLVRAMAVWALSRLLHETAFGRHRDNHLPRESDENVRAEWLAPVDATSSGPARRHGSDPVDA